MSDFAEYAQYDAMGLAELVRQGQVTPADLVEAAISRIEATNGRVNAVVNKMYDRARDAVRRGLPGGPFCGSRGAKPRGVRHIGRVCIE